MQRVLVLGCCGAGKSTFSKRLSEIVGLEVIHLDQHYWKANWVESAPEEWNKEVKWLAAKPSWLMDGNYAGTLDIRIKRADTIIYLDFSTIKCLWRITKRTIKHWGKERPDMPEGCKERFDLEFYHYVATFNLTRRKSLLDKLKTFKEEKEVIILKSDKESHTFLKNIKKGNKSYSS